MIAIKGMKMPKSCMDCDFRKSDPFSSEVYCNKLSCNENIIIYEDERLGNCPLVEIVTCKDCKHCVMTEVGCYCDRHIHRLNTHIDKYCADAERRE